MPLKSLSASFLIILNIYLSFQVNSSRDSLVIIAENFLQELHKFPNFRLFSRILRKFWQNVIWDAIPWILRYYKKPLFAKKKFKNLSKFPNCADFANFAKLFAVWYTGFSSLHFEVLQAHVWGKIKKLHNIRDFVKFVKITNFVTILVSHYLGRINLHTCRYLGQYLIPLERYGENKSSYKCCAQSAILNQKTFKKQLSFSFWGTLVQYLIFRLFLSAVHQ